MAKTIDKESNSAARTSDAVREPQDVEETDPVNEGQADDDFDADDAPLADEADDVDEADEIGEADESDERLAVAPVADAERAIARHAAGVQAPDFLLKNPFTRGLTEAYIELRKVTWPTRRDAWNMTIVVIVVSAIMAGLLAASDYGLGHLLSYFVSIGK